MLKCVEVVLFFFFVALLSACSLGGKGTPLSSATYGVPTRWLVNKEFSGRVLDFSSCAKVDKENETVLFYPSKCKPVSGAEITLSIGDSLPTEDGSSTDFRYKTKSDKDGRFRFERHTTIRLIDYHDNTYSAGILEIVAEGYNPFKDVVIWSYSAGDHMLGMNSEDKLREFAFGRIKNPLFIEITILK